VTQNLNWTPTFTLFLATMSIIRFKLVFFCPQGSTRDVLAHMFEKLPKEVGKIGHYEHCAFITRGVG
jgi:hypothetical protein